MKTTTISLFVITFLFLRCSIFDDCDELGERKGTLKQSKNSNAYPSHYESLSEVRFFNESNQVRIYAVSTALVHNVSIIDQVGTCKQKPVYSYYDVEELQVSLRGIENNFSIHLYTDVAFDIQTNTLKISLSRGNLISNSMALRSPFTSTSRDFYSLENTTPCIKR